MTLSYQGIKLKSEVNPNTMAQIFSVNNRTARNNRQRSIEQVEVIKVDQLNVKVNKSNWKAFHEFFTQNESF